MKRDIDLIKKILIAIEKKESIEAEDVVIDGYEPDVIAFHCILLNEAGFIKAVVNEKLERMITAYPTRLTWDGFEFLELSRNENAWKKTKDFVREKAVSVSVSLLIEVLKYHVKDTLGLNQGIQG